MYHCEASFDHTKRRHPEDGAASWQNVGETKYTDLEHVLQLCKAQENEISNLCEQLR